MQMEQFYVDAIDTTSMNTRVQYIELLKLKSHRLTPTPSFVKLHLTQTLG